MKRMRISAVFRSDANAWKVVPLLISHPALTAPALAQLTGLTPQSAVRTLGQLADAGMLAERTGQRRKRVWIHEEILQVLDQYAAHPTSWSRNPTRARDLPKQQQSLSPFANP